MSSLSSQVAPSVTWLRWVSARNLTLLQGYDSPVFWIDHSLLCGKVSCGQSTSEPARSSTALGLIVRLSWRSSIWLMIAQTGSQWIQCFLWSRLGLWREEALKIEQKGLLRLLVLRRCWWRGWIRLCEQGKVWKDRSEEAKAITRTSWNRCNTIDGPHRRDTGGLSHRRMMEEGGQSGRGHGAFWFSWFRQQSRYCTQMTNQASPSFKAQNARLPRLNSWHPTTAKQICPASTSSNVSNVDEVAIAFWVVGLCPRWSSIGCSLLSLPQHPWKPDSRTVCSLVSKCAWSLARRCQRWCGTE